MHNKHIGRTAMSKSENLYGLSPEQYYIQKAKVADIQDLNTRLFYYLIIKKRIPATIIFADLLYNYDLVVYSIASLSLKIFNAPKETIICTFTTLQNMTH